MAAFDDNVKRPIKINELYRYYNETNYDKLIEEAKGEKYEVLNCDGEQIKHMKQIKMRGNGLCGFYAVLAGYYIATKGKHNEPHSNFKNAYTINKMFGEMKLYNEGSSENHSIEFIDHKGDNKLSDLIDIMYGFYIYKTNITSNKSALYLKDFGDGILGLLNKSYIVKDETPYEVEINKIKYNQDHYLTDFGLKLLAIFIRVNIVVYVLVSPSKINIVQYFSGSTDTYNSGPENIMKNGKFTNEYPTIFILQNGEVNQSAHYDLLVQEGGEGSIVTPSIELFNCPSPTPETAAAEALPQPPTPPLPQPPTPPTPPLPSNGPTQPEPNPPTQEPKQLPCNNISDVASPQQQINYKELMDKIQVKDVYLFFMDKIQVKHENDIYKELMDKIQVKHENIQTTTMTINKSFGISDRLLCKLINNKEYKNNKKYQKMGIIFEMFQKENINVRVPRDRSDYEKYLIVTNLLKYYYQKEQTQFKDEEKQFKQEKNNQIKTAIKTIKEHAK